jgi:hypothetical protein
MDSRVIAERMRFWLGLLALFALFGVIVELILLQHDEEWRQWLPIGVSAVTALLLASQLARPSAGGVLMLRVSAVVLVVSGVLGVYFHYQGNLEFQMEIDAAQHGWALMRKILEAKAPPALAPGVLVQLGVLTLIYTYRHPELQ